MAFAGRVRAGDIIHINVEIELPGQIRRVEDPAGHYGNHDGIGIILIESRSNVAHTFGNRRFAENNVANSVSIHCNFHFSWLKYGNRAELTQLNYFAANNSGN